MSTRPDFLVVGAQKCGTTTLYEDLRAHPNVALAEKESQHIFLDAAARESAYDKVFGSSPRVHRINGEVSTVYAMLPDRQGTAELAAEVNPDMRIVYIVRDPIDRVLSHHHHDFALSLVPANINEAVRTHPQLLNHSRYAMQIRPWFEQFQDVLVIRFEDYMEGRTAGRQKVGDFLGLSPWPDNVDDDAHNVASEKHVATGGWRRIAMHPVYRQYVRGLVPETVRRKVTTRILPKAPERPEAPSAATFEFLIRELQPEVIELAQLTGSDPWWDLKTHQTAV